MSRLSLSVVALIQADKQSYSFAKNDRFPKIKAAGCCPLSCYDVPSTIYHKRSTSFGYGNKLDFTKTNILSPSPDNYHKGPDFDKQISKKKGKTFGTARPQMEEYGHITLGPLKNPGVGKYNINRDLGNIHFTVAPKTKDLYSPVFLTGKRTYLENPGPGAHETIDAISKDGKQYLSKYSSSKSKNFNPTSSLRFLNPATFVPGVGHYPTYEQSGIKGNAKYVLSNHKSCGTRAFSHHERTLESEEIAKYKMDIPGPGFYKIPLAFGNLDDQKKIDNNLKTINEEF